jgi:hypothetical protein
MSWRSCYDIPPSTSTVITHAIKGGLTGRSVKQWTLSERSKRITQRQEIDERISSMYVLTKKLYQGSFSAREAVEGRGPFALMSIHSTAPESRLVHTMHPLSTHRALQCTSDYRPLIYRSPVHSQSLAQSVSILFDYFDKTISSDQKDPQLNRPTTSLSQPASRQGPRRHPKASSQ